MGSVFRVMSKPPPSGGQTPVEILVGAWSKKCVTTNATVVVALAGMLLGVRVNDGAFTVRSRNRYAPPPLARILHFTSVCGVLPYFKVSVVVAEPSDPMVASLEKAPSSVDAVHPSFSILIRLPGCRYPVSSTVTATGSQARISEGDSLIL